MSDTLDSLSRKKLAAAELESVVRTMKAMAAANIGQYEMAVAALKDYYRTITLGVTAYFRQQDRVTENLDERMGQKDTRVSAVVFGSDQGLVGRFNDLLAEFALHTLNNIPGKKEIWVVGERMQGRLSDAGIPVTKLFSVPNSVDAIGPMVGRILMGSEESREKGRLEEFYVFYNSPGKAAGYESLFRRLLPLDKKWKEELEEPGWPAKNLPQVAGQPGTVLERLIREYLFVTLFSACAESLASENASRLVAMQRAEKNIDEMLADLNQSYHRMRQRSIDQELFDVISGFEALKVAGG